MQFYFSFSNEQQKDFEKFVGNNQIPVENLSHVYNGLNGFLVKFDTENTRFTVNDGGELLHSGAAIHDINLFRKNALNLEEIYNNKLLQFNGDHEGCPPYRNPRIWGVHATVLDDLIFDAVRKAVVMTYWNGEGILKDKKGRSQTNSNYTGIASVLGSSLMHSRMAKKKVVEAFNEAGPNSFDDPTILAAINHGELSKRIVAAYNDVLSGHEVFPRATNAQEVLDKFKEIISRRTTSSYEKTSYTVKS